MALNTRENTWVNTDNRIFYLSENVDKSSIGRICFELLFIINQDNKEEQEKREYNREPIKLYINSGGGDIYDMWGLIDIILNSKTPIYTYCTGYAMSAAFCIFLAGHKRFAYPHSTFMYHQISSWHYGKIEELKENVKEIKRLQREMEEYILSRTNITKEQLKENRAYKQNWFIPTQEALELGILTKEEG